MLYMLYMRWFDDLIAWIFLVLRIHIRMYSLSHPHSPIGTVMDRDFVSLMFIIHGSKTHTLLCQR